MHSREIVFDFVANSPHMETATDLTNQQTNWIKQFSFLYNHAHMKNQTTEIPNATGQHYLMFRANFQTLPMTGHKYLIQFTDFQIKEI